MKQFNYNICDNCGEENPLYLRICKKCNHSTREKVVNINLWETIYELLHAPTKTLKNIIYSEHKNFITFILFLLGIKIYLISIIFQTSFGKAVIDSNNKSLNLAVISVFYVLVLLLFSFILKIILKRFGILTRFKDNLSIIVYSFLPFLIASLILIPIEYGIFGEYWFTFNPSPFIIKPTSAYLLYGIELIMFVWSLLILFKGMVLQSGNYLRALSIIFAFFLIVGIAVVNIPYYLF